jgi:cytochrome c-type biogenesis protein
MLQGALLLTVYSMGLGIPFILSALLMSHLTDLFTKIKSHYGVIKKISGGILILVGMLTAFGLIEKLMSLFA